MKKKGTKKAVDYRKPDLQYRCKHCGRWRADHKAVVYPCPTALGSFTSFDPTSVYEGDKTRPKVVPFTI